MAFSKDSTFIAGRVDDSKFAEDGGHISIVVYNSDFPMAYVSNATRYEHKTNGLFRMNIAAPNEYFYAEITCVTKKGESMKTKSDGVGGDLYRFKKDDSIYILIKDKKLIFSGRGAEKLQCQSEIYQTRFLSKENQRRLLLSLHENQYHHYQLTLKILDSVLTERINIVKAYKSKLSPQEYNMLIQDCWGHMHRTMLRILRFDLKVVANKYQYGPIVRDFFFQEYLPYVQSDNNFESSNSALLIQSLFEKERLMLEMSSSDTIGFRYNFGDLYANIETNYNGDFRDKLMTVAFLTLLNVKPDAHNYLENAIQFIQNAKCKQIFENLKGAYLLNGRSPKYFSFVDTIGKNYTIEDFRGKVVVADFWFNGCRPCVKMAGYLKNVMTRYHGNPNLVFISINVDHSRDVWMNGLKSGQYTSEKQINLSTGDSGYNHPLLSYYNFSGFPKLMIIDKYGKIATLNPPIPNEKGIQSFCQIIDELVVKEKED